VANPLVYLIFIIHPPKHKKKNVRNTSGQPKRRLSPLKLIHFFWLYLKRPIGLPCLVFAHDSQIIFLKLEIHYSRTGRNRTVIWYCTRKFTGVAECAYYTYSISMVPVMGQCSYYGLAVLSWIPLILWF
jgi:hypothetical protein